MRIEKTVKNITYNIANAFLNTILKFVNRTVFIKILGVTFLGVNGLFTNILTLLSIAELGIGTAIGFSLYKPLAEKNNELISSIMTFYKKTYQIIGTIIFCIGFILMFFLDVIIKDTSGIENIRMIYFIFLMITVIPYYFSYMETLITADQNNYKLVPINFIFTAGGTILQIISLLLSKNYIIYLLVQLGVIIIQRIYINLYIIKKYQNINFKSKTKIPVEEFKNIIKNVKALILHKISGYTISCTENIVISAFIGITIVGIYSNYAMLISIVNTFVMLIFTSATSSFGNLITENNKQKQTDLFKKFDFLGFWIYGFSSLCLLLLTNDFISIWIGKEYLLSFDVLLLLCVNNYLLGMRMTLDVVRTAAGLYDNDKYLSVIQAFINIVVSIILVQKIGLIGVFVGTLLGGLLSQIARPFIIYRKLFDERIRFYFLRQLKFLISIIIVYYITNFTMSLIKLESIYMNLVLEFAICIITINVILYIIYHRSNSLKYYKDLIFNYIFKGGKTCQK